MAKEIKKTKKEAEKAEKAKKKDAGKSKKGKDAPQITIPTWSKKEGKNDLAALLGESAAAEILALKASGQPMQPMTPQPKLSEVYSANSKTQPIPQSARPLSSLSSQTQHVTPHITSPPSQPSHSPHVRPHPATSQHIPSSPMAASHSPPLDHSSSSASHSSGSFTPLYSESLSPQIYVTLDSYAVTINEMCFRFVFLCVLDQREREIVREKEIYISILCPSGSPFTWIASEIPPRLNSAKKSSWPSRRSR